MENKSKNIFYIACALGIFIYSMDKLYKIWHMHQDQALQNDIRHRMDDLYQKEFEAIYYREKTDRAYLIAEIFGGKGPRYDLTVLEERMVADGYTHAEAVSFRNKAYDKYKNMKTIYSN